MLREVHSLVVQEKQFEQLLGNQRRQFAQKVLNGIRSVILKSRRFCLAQVWYSTLNGGKSTAGFFQSPVSDESSWQIYDSPASIPCSTSLSMQINSFMKNLERLKPVILECMDRYFSLHNRNEKPPRYALSNSPLHFFSASTFFGLYGHGWCLEQSVACVRAITTLIVKQAKASGTSLSVQFKKSYVQVLVRQWMQMVGIQSYLILSLADEFFLLSNDPIWTRIDESSSDVMLKIVSFVKNIIDNLLLNLSQMPSIIKFFFAELRRVASDAFEADSGEPRRLIEHLFFENVLSAALLNPKMYGLLSETTQNSPSYISAVLKVVRFGLHAEEFQGAGNQSFDQYSQLEPFKELKACELLESLMTLTTGPEDLEGLYASEVQRVCDISYQPLLISINDIMFLSDVVKETIDKVDGPDDIKNRLQTTLDFSRDSLAPYELHEFWYESFTLPGECVQPPPDSRTEFALPVVGPFEPPALSPFEQKTVTHLVNYLESIPQGQVESDDLLSFLDTQMKEARENENNELIAKTQAIKGKIESLGKTSAEVLEILKSTIHGNTSNHISELTISYDIQTILATVEKMESDITRMRANIEPVLHSSVVNTFAERHDISLRLSIIEDDSPKLYTQLDHWYVYYIPLARELITFSDTFFNASRAPLLRQLHSFICRRLPLPGFVAASDLERHLTEAGASVRTVSLPSDSCYASLASMLQHKFTVAQTPLDKLSVLVEVIDALEDVITFKENTTPDDEKISAILAELLSAACPNHIPAIRAYMLHFLTFREDDPNVLEAKSARGLRLFNRACEVVFKTC